MSEMGLRIRKLRQEKGMTQQELADKVGMQRSAVNKYEMGLVENIKRTTIMTFARVLECDPMYLMAFDDSDADKYATDEDLERLHSTPELRVLLSATDGLSKKDIEMLADIARRMNNEL